jgi:lipoprotein-anchoring transpeptidase ErfK/SrfK
MAQVRSLLHVSGPMRFGDSIWNERGATTGEIWIRVDLAKQLISVFRGGDEIGTAVILYGADSHLTPQGTFSILGKSKQHRSRAYGALMPYSLWLTKDGVAIHASEVRRGLATHGCIGVPIDFSKRLFSIAEPGDKVVIVRS